MDAASDSDNGSPSINVGDPANQADPIKKTFDRILDILKQLGVHRRSPKFFVIYAHKNIKYGIEANKDVVTDYISWFKKSLFNVDSDKSPHGYGPAHSQAHAGASGDIIRNQICLLPHGWNKHNVDYVLIFYSKLLAQYMRDERDFKIGNQTYTDAIFKTCSAYTDKHPIPWDEVCTAVSVVQKTYSSKMKDKFHHVLTELALLKFRQSITRPQYAIPILLFDGASQTELSWQSQFLCMKETQIWLPHKSGGEHERFFKILLMFETLENDRPVIEALKECYLKCVGLLKEGRSKRNEYHTQMEVEISLALRDLNNDERHWMIERPITKEGIRDILNLHSFVARTSMKRVSGDILPDNLSDIELALGQDANPNSIQDSSARVEDSNSEDYQPKRPTVSISNLLDEGHLKGKKKIQPRRVLIQGRPGVGKTTLSKRIMYEYSWNDRLRRGFDLVIRVPVRKLEQVADLADLLFDEYFQAASKGRKLSNHLRDLMLGKGNASIMIILDGLDEYQQWSQGKRDLLKKLMNQSAVILTSRFYDAPETYLRIEARGLSMDSVRAYVENPDVVASSTRQYILDHIESNPFIKEMIQVPIHLDMLCYSWDELHRQRALFTAVRNVEQLDVPTITALYWAIVHRFWRKDIPALDKIDNGEQVTTEIVDAIEDASRLGRLVFPENSLLEELAINLMESNRFEFGNEDINEVIQHLESSGTRLPLSLERNLKKLSFLHSEGRGQRRRLSFIHLTFQEFFAAQGLTKDIQRLSEYLRQYKYSLRFERVWSFVAGLLQTKQDNVNRLYLFFSTIEKEPRDLLGTAHQQLVINCLNEVMPFKEVTIFDHLRLDIETQLSKWLKFEQFRDVWYLTSAKKMGAAVLCNVLEQNIGDEDFQVDLLLAITKGSQLPLGVITLTTGWLRNDTSPSLKQFVLDMLLISHQFLPPKALKAVQGRLEDEDLNIRIEAVKVLGYQSTLSPDISAALVRALKDNNSEMRREAARALGSQSTLSLDVLAALVETLRDKYAGVEAALALGHQTELPPDIMASLLRMLRDNDGGLGPAKALGFHPALSLDVLSALADILGNYKTRKAAAHALEHQETLPQDILADLVKQLNDKSSDVRGAALYALQSQRVLPPYILPAMITLLEQNYQERTQGAAKRLKDQCLEAIKAMLENRDEVTRLAVNEALKRQTVWPQDISGAMTAALEDRNVFVRSKAVRTLTCRGDLPPEILPTVVAALKNDKSDIRLEAFKILSCQVDLPIECFKAIVAMLKDDDRSVATRAATICSAQADLPEQIQGIISEMLEDGNIDIRRAAVSAFPKRLDLPLNILKTTVAILKEEKEGEFSGFGCVKAADVCGRSTLSGEILEAVLGILEDENRLVRQLAVKMIQRASAFPLYDLTAAVGEGGDELALQRWLVDTIQSGRLTFPGGTNRMSLKVLYHKWLEKSFGTYWCWYVIDNVSYIETSGGRMELPLNGKREFVEAIREAQTEAGVPGLDRLMMPAEEAIDGDVQHRGSKRKRKRKRATNSKRRESYGREEKRARTVI
ncbi:hypothetical protein F4680DRAFT_180100 [Xylaria scruposa]|nr:hypothetical protein F4680DRAFT_180100 [Xylaria scruposa]